MAVAVAVMAVVADVAMMAVVGRWLWWLQWMYRLGCCPNSPQSSESWLPPHYQTAWSGSLFCVVFYVFWCRWWPSAPQVCRTHALWLSCISDTSMFKVKKKSVPTHTKTYITVILRTRKAIHSFIHSFSYLFLPHFFVPRNWKADKHKHGWMNILVLWKGRKLEQNKKHRMGRWGSMAEFLLSIRKVLGSKATTENKNMLRV